MSNPASESKNSELQTTLPSAAEVVSLRREALLPAERRRPITGVTAACTLAGVASGLALATTLMAMQVADNIARTKQTPTCRGGMRSEQRAGFLGIGFAPTSTGAEIERVIANTPAQDIGLRPGDVIESVNGLPVSGDANRLKRAVLSQPPGAEVELIVNRPGDSRFVVRPILAAWPK